MMDTDKDVRKHSRSPLEVTVDWQVVGSDDVIWSATDDIGAGGLRVRTLTPPVVGTEVVLVLKVHPEDEPIRLPAHVAWTRLNEEFCGMGLAFDSIEPEAATRLQALLALLPRTP
jgi:Tfp pilus assembly protein PilZ